MIRYNITKLARPKNKRSRIVLPKIEERLGMVRSYKAILRRMLAALAAEVRQTVIPAYRYQQTLTRDAPEDTFAQLRAVAAMLAAAATRAVEGILNLESIKHTETFIDVARKTLGIDISAVVTQEDIADYLRTAATRNAGLIKSLSDDTVKKVEQAVLQNTLSGNSVKTLTETLVKDFGVSQSRAELIAADQSAKLTSDLNRIRQQQAEIEKYEWSTSHDERVRPLHQAIDGTEYKWSESTGAEGGLPPGQPIRCRCVARGIVDFGATSAKAVRKPRVTAPVPVQETPIARLQREAKSYVVTAGKKNGKEHLVAYSETMMLPVEKFTSGKKGSVAISPALQQAMMQRGNKVVVHHNHPSSSSFSAADLVLLHKYDVGLDAIWAHGHNGSSYRARRGVKQMKAADYAAVEKTLKPGFQNEVNSRSRGENLDDLNLIFHHVVSLVLQKKGFIEYFTELSDVAKAAFERNKTLIGRYLNDTD